MKLNLKNNLSKTSPYPELGNVTNFNNSHTDYWSHLRLVNDSEMGYFDAGYSKKARHWNIKAERLNGSLETRRLINEFDRVLNEFIEEFPNPEFIEKWCYEENLEPCPYNENAYEVWYVGKYGIFEFRLDIANEELNTVSGFRIHCFSKRFVEEVLGNA